MIDIAIIDYGMCNLDSVARAVERCGGSPLVTDSADEAAAAAAIVLPGVGAFAEAMQRLHDKGLADTLRSLVLEQGVPFLGICLGMQLMADSGREGGQHLGLGLVPGEVVPLRPAAPDERIPHVGWNEVRHGGGHPLFEGIEPGTDFYFVHGFHFRCRHEAHVLARTPYCGGFVSAVGRGQCLGVQFHPEKSLAVGQRLLSNFIANAENPNHTNAAP